VTIMSLGSLYDQYFEPIYW